MNLMKGLKRVYHLKIVNLYVFIGEEWHIGLLNDNVKCKV